MEVRPYRSKSPGHPALGLSTASPGLRVEFRLGNLGYSALPPVTPGLALLAADLSAAAGLSHACSFQTLDSPF